MVWLTLGPLPGLSLSDRTEAVRQGLLEDPRQTLREGGTKPEA